MWGAGGVWGKIRTAVVPIFRPRSEPLTKQLANATSLAEIGT
jgi:hypothetical protein